MYDDIQNFYIVRIFLNRLFFISLYEIPVTSMVHARPKETSLKTYVKSFRIFLVITLLIESNRIQSKTTSDDIFSIIRDLPDPKVCFHPYDQYPTRCFSIDLSLQSSNGTNVIRLTKE